MSPCFSASRLGSAAAQAVGSPPSLWPFSEWWICLKVICVLAATHVHGYPQPPGKTSVLASSWDVTGNPVTALPLCPCWDPCPMLNPSPAPLPPWWHLTYITTQGASSSMALTSPSCRSTHYAHACLSSYRTLSSSVAPSGESLYSCPNRRPALLSEQRWGSLQRTAFFIRPKQALWVPLASQLLQVLHSLPPAPCALPSTRWSVTVTALSQALPWG